MIPFTKKMKRIKKRTSKREEIKKKLDYYNYMHGCACLRRNLASSFIFFPSWMNTILYKY